MRTIRKIPAQTRIITIMIIITVMITIRGMKMQQKGGGYPRSTMEYALFGMAKRGCTLEENRRKPFTHLNGFYPNCPKELLMKEKYGTTYTLNYNLQ